MSMCLELEGDYPDEPNEFVEAWFENDECTAPSGDESHSLDDDDESADDDESNSGEY